jgi:hypothetical protein
MNVGCDVINSERFFSYTETSDDISVVLDEKSMSEFPSRALVMSPGVWKAIQIWEGPDAIGMYYSLLIIPSINSNINH